MEIDDPTRAEVRFGVDPRDAAHLVTGASVVFALEGNTTAEPLTSTVTRIAGQVDPETRLVDVFAAVPSPCSWILGSVVTAKIPLSAKRALVIPRAAALAVDGRHTVFTVVDGHALRHEVVLGLQNNQQVEIAGAEPPLHAGDSVVVQGNYELEDGMAVLVAAAP